MASNGRLLRTKSSFLCIRGKCWESKMFLVSDIWDILTTRREDGGCGFDTIHIKGQWRINKAYVWLLGHTTGFLLDRKNMSEQERLDWKTETIPRLKFPLISEWPKVMGAVTCRQGQIKFLPINNIINIIWWCLSSHSRNRQKSGRSRYYIADEKIDSLVLRVWKCSWEYFTASATRSCRKRENESNPTWIQASFSRTDTIRPKFTRTTTKKRPCGNSDTILTSLRSKTDISSTACSCGTYFSLDTVCVGIAIWKGSTRSSWAAESSSVGGLEAEAIDPAVVEAVACWSIARWGRADAVLADTRDTLRNISALSLLMVWGTLGCGEKTYFIAACSTVIWVTEDILAGSSITTECASRAGCIMVSLQ